MSNVICFKYGLLAPIENKDLVGEQIFEGHCTYNNYIAAIIDIRNQKRAILNSVQDPELELKKESAIFELDLAKSAINNARIELSSKKVPQELTQRVNAAKKSLRDINKLCSEFKKAHKDDIRPLLAVVKEDANSKKRDVYNNNDLFWGSDLLIRKSVDQADKTTPIFSNPKFRVWKGVGQIGIQNQKAMPVEELFTQNDHVWIERIHQESHSRRSNNRAVLHIRIQSGEKRKPIFASFPMIMHRPFPDGAKVSWVSVKRNKIGSRDEWSVSFTLDISGRDKISNNYQDKAVAIDIGWRQCVVDDEKYSIRVCVWSDENGNAGEFILDSKIVDRLKIERSLSSIRKTNFNEVLKNLVEWCKSHDMPDWLLESTRSKKSQALPTKAQAIAWLEGWKSEARLAALVIKWSRNRFFGDESIFGCRPKKDNGKPIKDTLVGLEGWRYNDHHIWNMLESIRVSIRRCRREQYRLFAHTLASKYSTLVIEDFDISKVAEKATLGSVKEIDRNNKAQSNRQLTAPSELIGCLKLAFDKVGSRVLAVNPANTSKRCYVCGSIEEIGSNQIHTCTKCSSVWDRDFNSCHNQLRIWREQSGDVKILIHARTDEKTNKNKKIKGEKWKKVVEYRAEKKLKSEASRNDCSKHSALQAS